MAGTLSNLEDNLNDLVPWYDKKVIVVEYSALKEEVNKIVFSMHNVRDKRICILEPLSNWEKFFDHKVNRNQLLLKYDELSKKFL